MLARQAMYVGTHSEVLAHVLYKEIPPPSSLRRGVPADLEAVAMKLLERDLRSRYAKADDVITDLLRCKGIPISGRDEVAAHLARLAQALPAQATRGTTFDTISPVSIAQLTGPIKPSTLGSGAVESTPRDLPTRSRSWRRLVLWLAPIVGAMITFVAARTVR